MRTINLADLDNSDIKYTISRFPDGQQDIVIIPPILLEYAGRDISYIIESRFNSFKDLELIICTNKALERLGVKEIHLNIPYLLGARSDRHFQEGGNSYLVDIIAPIINAQEFKSVTVLDVHSDVAAACIKNLKVIDNSQLIHFALTNIYKTNSNIWENGNNYENPIYISPDGGALKKIYKVLDKLTTGLPYGEVITCSKSRDTEGNLTKTIVPITFEQLKSEKDFIIIDDICDGGRTFINIAKEIKAERKSAKIYLIVTHGIFSNKFNDLCKYIDGIYTTNSIKDIWQQDFIGSNYDHDKVKQYKVI